MPTALSHCFSVERSGARAMRSPRFVTITWRGFASSNAS
jgi:hypothetical protein